MPPIFDATATLEDVLSGFNLKGSRVLVTGCSTGIGLETVRGLLHHGASVVGTTRDPQKAQDVARRFRPNSSGNPDLQILELDLASLASVRACADKLVSEGEPLDLIIANAGIMAGPRTQTAEGTESQFGVNFLGHFVLVNRIAELLKRGGRVVLVSSAGHRRSDVDLDDVNFFATPYDPYLAYGRSKSATILFAIDFDRRFRTKGIRATAVHPGAIKTDTVLRLIEGLGDGKDAAMASFDWKTVEQGAATSVWAGIVASADEVGGRYCEDCHVAPVNDDPEGRTGVRSYALDERHAQALWEKAEELTGERFQQDL